MANTLNLLTEYGTGTDAARAMQCKNPFPPFYGRVENSESSDKLVATAIREFIGADVARNMFHCKKLYRNKK